MRSVFLGVVERMHIFHVALQGCLRAKNIEYGLTPDTGGHITYLMDLVKALGRADKNVRNTIVTRKFKGQRFDADYWRSREVIDDRTDILRIGGDSDCYLSKENMYIEWDALSKSFNTLLDRLNTSDAIVHAHYADAAVLAERSGLPFFFTGHSYGLVKESLFRNDLCQINPASYRLRAENLGLRTADAVIASSKDERDKQISLYSSKPQACHIIPPGFDSRFCRSKVSDQSVNVVNRELSRFLTDETKPMVLAIARPVARKNLTGLLEAFADSGLKSEANLVIVAGERETLGSCTAEIRKELKGLIEGIDDRDLWGSVAMPKHHLSEHIPAYYEVCKRSGGIFVNPALQEPFGLTLLEAAAMGVPVVATNRGGPTNIVSKLENGILVDPRQRITLMRAMTRLLGNRALWERCAASGLENISSYSWDSHASTYLAHVEKLIARGCATGENRAAI